MIGEQFSYGYRGMHASLLDQQNPLMDLETEVLDSMPDISDYLQTGVIPYIRTYPDRVAEVRLIAESGSIKGALGSQIVVFLLTDQALEGHLEAHGRTLDVGYISTKMIVVEGEKNGRIINQPGQRTRKEFEEAGRDAHDVVIAAKTELPLREQNKSPEEEKKAHVIFVEAIPDVGPVQLTADIISAKEEPHLQHEEVIFDGIAEPEENPNSRFSIISITNPKIQRRTYRLRKKLERIRAEGRGGEDDVVTRFNTGYDMNPIDVLDTMGPADGIERLSKYMNMDMLQAFETGKFTLPEDTPEKLLQRDDPRKMREKRRRKFFENLTVFKDDDMKTHKLRPWLLEGYYDYLAREVWKLRSFVIVRPDFLEGSDIHSYPRLLKQYALPFEELLTIAQERQRQSEAVFSVGETHEANVRSN